MFIPESFNKITAIRNEKISNGKEELSDDRSGLNIRPSDAIVILSKALSTIFLKSGSAIIQESLDNILKNNIETLQIADVDPITKGSYLIDTLNIDKNNTKEEAINDIYKVLRPGEPPSFEAVSYTHLTLPTIYSV